MALSAAAVRTVPQPDSVHASRVDWAAIEWFPDSDSFVAEISPFDEGCTGCDPWSTWIVPLLGGPPHKIRDDSAAESVSPDGSLIAYTTVLGIPGGKEIWVMSRDGGNPRKIVDIGGRGVAALCEVAMRNLSNAQWRTLSGPTIFTPTAPASPKLIVRLRNASRYPEHQESFINEPVNSGSLFWAAASGASSMQLAVIPSGGGDLIHKFQVPGFRGTLRWSPDGKALHYVLTGWVAVSPHGSALPRVCTT